MIPDLDNHKSTKTAVLVDQQPQNLDELKLAKITLTTT